MIYAIKEVFPTIQGEGYHAGTPAVFVRFAGCNMWSGHANDRTRDHQRTGAECPLWCDTDFVGGDKLTSAGVVSAVLAAQASVGTRLIVITGGEPLLQLDQELVDMFCMIADTVAIETNGTAEPKFDPGGVWLTVSPKLMDPDAICDMVAEHASELKVVYPAYEPTSFLERCRPPHLFVQPQAVISNGTIGASSLDAEATSKAAWYVMAHADWRLSIQTHKIAGLP